MDTLCTFPINKETQVLYHEQPLPNTGTSFTVVVSATISDMEAPNHLSQQALEELLKPDDPFDWADEVEETLAASESASSFPDSHIASPTHEFYSDHGSWAQDAHEAAEGTVTDTGNFDWYTCENIAPGNEFLRQSALYCRQRWHCERAQRFETLHSQATPRRPSAERNEYKCFMPSPLRQCVTADNDTPQTTLSESPVFSQSTESGIFHDEVDSVTQPEPTELKSKTSYDGLDIAKAKWKKFKDGPWSQFCQKARGLFQPKRERESNRSESRPSRFELKYVLFPPAYFGRQRAIRMLLPPCFRSETRRGRLFENLKADIFWDFVNRLQGDTRRA